MNNFTYVGAELDLFAAVHKWKTYWSGRIQCFIQGDVLEVGAGIGSNTPFLDARHSGRWLCLEPDSRLVAQLTRNLRGHEAVRGTLASLDAGETFDTIIYIDVLEHIEGDRQELAAAAAHLRPGGRIIVLSPAHQKLFTPFDAAIGHFRRYNRQMLRSISPSGVRIERLFYLDSAGLALSTANLLFLRQSMPTRAQLHVWDTYVIPISRILDPCLFNLIGKSIVGIWRKGKD